MTLSIKQINKLVLIRNSVLVSALMFRYLHGKLITTPWQQKREFSPEWMSVKKEKQRKENTGVSWNTFCTLRPSDFLITFFLLLVSATRMDMICWSTWQCEMKPTVNRLGGSSTPNHKFLQHMIWHSILSFQSSTCSNYTACHQDNHQYNTSVLHINIQYHINVSFWLFHQDENL